MNCPNCSTEMDHMALAGKYGTGIEVDLCFACHAIWLDKRESLQLSPRGTLDLFEVIHEHRDDPRHSLGSDSACARCGTRLKLMRDIGKAGRFSYYRCPDGHGRLTPFSEFLKEKQFVRQLNAAEKSRVRAELKQVQCSSCGAPVDLERGFDCGHCGSAISVLDADAVAKTLHELESADAATQEVDPADAEKRARAIMAMESMRTTDPEDLFRGAGRLPRHGLGTDLLSASINLIFGSF